MKKVTIGSGVGALLFTLALPVAAFAATPTFTATESVANGSAGTNNQTAVTAPTQANVAQVKAARTLTVNSLPVASTTSAIGSCTVTYSTTVADSLSCAGNAAIINVTTHNTATTLASTLAALTSVTDAVNSHGALTPSTAGVTATFTTAGTETSASLINFTDGTSGAVSSTASTTGVIPVVQINTLTIGGTVDTGDVFTATLPTVGAVSYTVLSSDTTTSMIANGLRTAIVASSGYGSQAFTAATSTNTIIFTAKVAGTGFTQTSSATNRAATGQQVVFTPVDADAGYTFDVRINGADYISNGGTAQNIVEDLNGLLAGNTAVTCSEDNVSLACSAAVPGTSFTYATFVDVVHGGGGGGGSSHRSGSSHTTTTSSTSSDTSTPVVSPVQMPVPPLATVFSRDLTLGATGEDVRNLQVWLNAHGFVVATTGAGSAGNETTLFGRLTQKALAKWQAAHGITPAVGYFGPKTRAALK